jgi:hypothetical protein
MRVDLDMAREIGEVLIYSLISIVHVGEKENKNFSSFWSLMMPLSPHYGGAEPRERETEISPNEA